jgi:hypothetical protein
MQIAILFYGRIKHYEKKYLLNILEKGHTVDIFYSCDNEPEELVNDFKTIYNPISVNSEPITYDRVIFDYYSSWANKTESLLITNTHLQYDRMIRHFINLKRVMELLEESCSNLQTTYDLVIATRFDLLLGPMPPLCIPKPNTIYIPEGNDYNGLNDQFAMGSLESMKRYMYLFNNYPRYMELNILPHPETLNMCNLRENDNMDIGRFDMEHIIIR